MAVYRPQDLNAISEITLANRLSDPVYITGTDQTISVPKGIFFLEMLIIDGSGTVTITDGNGNVIGTGVKDFEQDYSPIRCDEGVTLTGDVALAKGFVIQSVFTS